MSFERKELWDIRERAQNHSKGAHLVPTWRRAYEALADAANNLDAIIARTIVCECKVNEDE